MKKIYLLASLFAILISYNLCGAENMNKFNYGCQKYKNETMNSIQENGSVVLEQVKVLGNVQVNGSLNAEESEMGSLEVNGQAELNNCLISYTTVVNGSLNANNTRFQENLSVASQKIVLKMCSVDSIIVREIGGYTGTQIIDLRSGSNVTGEIVFESGNGEVWISSNSRISEALVSGAKVYRK